MNIYSELLSVARPKHGTRSICHIVVVFIWCRSLTSQTFQQQEKFVPVHAMTAYKWSRSLALLIPNFGNRCSWVIKQTPQSLYLLTYLLTYSMVRSPSWEANWFAVSQEIPRISRNPKVHYRTHKRPPPVPILDQPNPVHINTSHLLEVRSNIIHPSTPRSPQWSPSFRFPHQDPNTPSPHPYALHAQPTSFFSILSTAQCWVRSTDH